jgi:hypothetical protein
VTYGFWLQVVGAHFGQVRDGVKPIFLWHTGAQSGQPHARFDELFCGHKLKKTAAPMAPQPSRGRFGYQNLM